MSQGHPPRCVCDSNVNTKQLCDCLPVKVGGTLIESTDSLPSVKSSYYTTHKCIYGGDYNQSDSDTVHPVLLLLAVFNVRSLNVSLFHLGKNQR